MATSYRDYAARLSPAWLLNYFGAKAVGALGLVFDVAAEELLQAITARAVDSVTFPSDALPYLGSARQIERVPNDTDATYKARLAGAWDAWRQAGTKICLKAQLAAYGLTAEIYENHTWNWDSNAANWSRFWVVITVHPWSTWQWGDGYKYGGGRTWGLTATAEEISSLRRIVRKWKPGHVVCAQIVVVTHPLIWAADFPPSGNWNDPAHRSKGAVYVDG